jgi:adenylate cyclase
VHIQDENDYAIFRTLKNEILIMQVTLSEQGSAPVADPTTQQSTVICHSYEGISLEEKLAELNRVISSPDFPATLRNRRFLSFAVKRTLEAPVGVQVRVRAYDVATQIFGRSDDFSTILDPIVRIEAGKLRRDLETYYLKSGRSNPLRIELPRGGYGPIFLRQEAAEETGPQAPAALGDLAADARAELDRVVKSADFPATDRNRKFLSYVVENELAGRFEEITPVLLGQRVFQRDESFNPNKDPIVRIEAGKLRRDLETYYLKAGRRNPLRISIPKGGYRPAFASAV